MKLREEFSLKGKLWKLKRRWCLRASDGEKVRGLCDFDTRTIWLDRLLVGEEAKLIFMHEVVHAALYEAHLDHNSGLSAEIEEIIADAVADAFNELFVLRFKKA